MVFVVEFGVGKNKQIGMSQQFAKIARFLFVPAFEQQGMEFWASIARIASALPPTSKYISFPGILQTLILIIIKSYL